MLILLTIIIIFLISFIFYIVKELEKTEKTLMSYKMGAIQNKTTYNRMYQTILRRDARIQNLLKKANNLKHN